MSYLETSTSACKIRLFQFIFVLFFFVDFFIYKENTQIMMIDFINVENNIDVFFMFNVQVFFLIERWTFE